MPTQSHWVIHSHKFNTDTVICNIRTTVTLLKNGIGNLKTKSCHEIILLQKCY